MLRFVIEDAIDTRQRAMIQAFEQLALEQETLLILPLRAVRLLQREQVALHAQIPDEIDRPIPTFAQHSFDDIPFA